MVAQQVGAFAHGVSLGDIPASVRHQAKRTLLNYFGCACGGARHESVQAVIRGRAAWSGQPIATVFGRPEMFDPALAALLNGMSSAVYSFDDTHADALVHPGGPVASSVLALARVHPAPGSELLLSFIVGAEIVCRLSKSVSTPPAKARAEWVQTGICAGVGAAAGAARRLGLSQQQITFAMGIAASRASGLRALSRSMCFSYMAGSAAESGVNSAILAQAGMTSAEDPFTGPHGFCAAFSAGPHLEYLTTDLGENYELGANTFKPYPCGVVIHPAIDAALSLAGRIRKPAEIEQIAVEVHPSTEKLSNMPEPKDQFEAQVSMQHWVACAVLNRTAGVEQTTEECLQSQSIADMRRRISFTPNPEMARDAARVHIQLRSGETLQEAVAECRGSSRRPLSDHEIEAKYFNQAIPALGEPAARRLADACWNIEKLADSGIIALLAVSSGMTG